MRKLETKQVKRKEEKVRVLASVNVFAIGQGLRGQGREKKERDAVKRQE